MSTGFNTLLHTVPYVGRFAAWIGPWVFASLSMGSRTSAFAAAGKKVQEERAAYKGVYLVPVAKIAEPSASAKDERLARELHATTREVLKELGV
jgi:hypothetical protein